MFLIRGLEGLGLTPREIAEQVASKPGGQAGRDSTAPYGWNRWGTDYVLKQVLAQFERRRDAMIMAIRALPDIKPCSSVLTKMKTNAYCRRAARLGYMDLLNPIGVIVDTTTSGVPFSPADLQAGVLEKTYQPNADQRVIADWSIYVASQWHVYPDLPSGGDIYPALTNPKFSGGIQRFLDRKGDSVNQFIAKGPRAKGTDQPDLTTSIPNYGMNPIAPTEAELTEKNGMAAYYARGGFLLSKDVASGLDAVAKKVALTWNTGYCLCDNGIPMAVPNFAAGEGYGWDTYFTVGPSYKVRIKPHDSPAWNDAINFAAGALKSLAGFICANRSIIQSVDQGILLKDLCQDTAGKECPQAGPGCYCTKPTGIQTASVAVANAGLELWCGLAKDWVNPTPATPFTPPPPPALPWEPPWGLIIAGGVVAGALAYAKGGSRR